MLPAINRRDSIDMRVVVQGPRPNRAWTLLVFTGMGRRQLAKRIASIPDVEITRKPRFLSWLLEDDFLEFRYRGVPYVAGVEPFAKNHFEIRCQPPGCKPETSQLKAELEQSEK